jgi:N-methylhydantoinase B
MKLDPVTLNILSNAFISIAREMGANLVRAAFSTVIREVKDVATAILDTSGEIVAQAEYIPIHLGGLPLAFKGSVKRYDLNDITSEDAFITNDPYNGGQHLQDWILFTPIFHKQHLVAFAGSSAHHIDIGGGAAGFHAGATDIYQEGIIIPGLKFNANKDWNGGLLERILGSNIRVPEKTLGDVNAQFAANYTAKNRMEELIERYDLETILTAIREVINYSEERTREKIFESFKPGEYFGEDYLENDPFTDDIATIRTKVTVEGSDIYVDFKGTDDQLPGPNNNPIASTVAATNAAVRCLINDPSIPFNSGCNRPIHLTIPKGTLLNPVRPTPVRCRMNPSYRAFGAIMRALAEANPSLAVAAGWDTTIVAILSYFDSETRKHSIFEEIFGGGFGGSAFHDGAEGIDSPLSNCLNTPIEATETEYDFIKVVGYRLLKDQFGRGRFRGGMAIQKDYMALKDGVRFAGYLDRRRVKPRGIFGGEDGTCGGFQVISSSGKILNLPCLSSIELKKGDVLRVTGGGGGGYKPPNEREEILIEKDRKEGKAS